MIVVDYSQTAISTLMTELRGHADAEISIPLVRHMIINALRSYKVKYGMEYGDIVIACDGKKYWRKQLFQYYKANRKKDRDDSKFDWNAIFEALNTVKNELSEFFPYPVVEVETAEADDIIATLVEWTQENALVQVGLDAEPQKVLIISGDNDFVQLQKYKNVVQFSPIQKKYLKTDTPHEDLMEHILSGDRGDGIPNYLSADDTFVTGTRQKPIRKKDLEKWRTLTIEDWKDNPNYQNILRNQSLIDLSKIPDDVKKSIINNYTQQLGVRSRQHLLNYFIEYKMKNLIDHITEF